MTACSRFEILISGYLDGELNEEQISMLKEHLVICAECRRELERGRMTKKVLDMAAIHTPEDDFWDGYWAGIYNRLERNMGWVFFIAGGIILLCGGLINFFQTVILAEDTPWWISTGGMCAIVGITVLIVSLIRERIRVNRHERYKDVRR